MSEIHESITVDVPFDRIPALAERFVSSLRSARGEPILPLTVRAGDLVVGRDVRLTIVAARRSPGVEVMEIRWEADGGGPYPAFTGTLVAEQETMHACRLDLDGSYEPPMSIAGAAFDAILGNRIAQASARNLLRRLRVVFESAHRSNPVAA